ncbi:hypothetical protein [Kocuria palustris]|uniref:hypothetical protein n=1 Tax=Kocuria palustris TaxID=71999 RepID=UPI00119EB433|nr:hypothetical protein [Kocuria palustris]
MDQNTAVRRAIGLWLVLLVLAMIAAWITISLVNKYMYGPETDVRAYFENLQEGDGGRALGLLNAEAHIDDDAVLLDGDPLARATESLEDLEVTTVSQSSEEAVVRADFTLDGQPHSSEYRLVPVDTQWGFFTVWGFEESVLPTVSVSMPGASSADLNGTSAALPDSQQDFAAFPPGVYSASYASRWIDTEPASVVLTDEAQHESIELEATPSAALETEVSRQIAADLAECTEQSSLYPADCPFSHDFDGRVQGDVTWRITQQPDPAITIGADGGRDWAMAAAPGTAEVSFTSVDLFDGSTEKVTESVPFTYDGSLDVSGDTVTVSR